jgi:hypothetical protein
VVMLAKLGEDRGKLFAQQKLKPPRFLSWACSGSDRLLVGDGIRFQRLDFRSQMSAFGQEDHEAFFSRLIVCRRWLLFESGRLIAEY